LLVVDADADADADVDVDVDVYALCLHARVYVRDCEFVLC
jgi:hypothetical protein